MFTSKSRALLASIVVALASLSSGTAVAQIPFVVHLQEFQPLPEEQEGPQLEPLPNEFGFDVDIRNGLAFMGMPLTMTTGQVAVFTRRTSGWVRTATIIASDRTSGDEFGRAVSFRNGLLVVGSARAVYVFKRIKGVWRQRQKITPAASDGVGFFARDLKHRAGVLAIGAFGNGTTRNSVYVFEQDATGNFVLCSRITPSDGRLGDRFGISISMTTRIIVVGAPGANAAYILARNRSGNWVQRQKLTAVGLDSDDAFGDAVAVDRGMILVGASGASVPGVDPERPLRGLVFGFLPGRTGYVESFQLSQVSDQPDGGVPDAWHFGISIAMSGKHIAVGGDRLEEGEQAGQAIVATYSRDGSSVLRVGSVPGHGRTPTSMSIFNNLLLVGSPYSGFCPFSFECPGEANLYDLNRFTPSQ